MAVSWYYVESNERRGPVNEQDLIGLILEKKLLEESYVWKKGFDNWKKINEVSDLSEYLGGTKDKDETSVDAKEGYEEEEYEKEEVFEKAESTREESKELTSFIWDEVDLSQKIFSIKVGLDRDGDDVEYGPYSITILKKLFEESRISEKTYVFSPGMENWAFLGDIPIFNKISRGENENISDEDRRVNIRKPFVARMFFHDQKDVFEGVCRDISIGGVQILVSGFPGKIKDRLNLNVHPENSEYCFTASGEVVRILDGNHGLSLRFLNLSKEAKEAIESYLNNF